MHCCYFIGFLTMSAAQLALPPTRRADRQGSSTSVLISQGNSSSQAYGVCWHAFGKRVSIWVGLPMLVLGPVHGANLLIHVV